MRTTSWFPVLVAGCVLYGTDSAQAQRTITWESFTKTRPECGDVCYATKWIYANLFTCWEVQNCQSVNGQVTSCSAGTNCSFVPLNGRLNACVQWNRVCEQVPQRLPDGDQINATFQPNAVSPTDVEIVLRAGPNVTWYKALQVTDGQGILHRISTQDKRNVESVTLPAYEMEASRPMTFIKAKEFGRWRQVYTLRGLDRIRPGTRVTFDWTAD